MTNSRFVLATAIAATLLAIAAGPAGAVEIGSRCTASGGDQGIRVQDVEVPGGPTYAAPTAGILTKWGLSAPNGQSGTVRLKIISYSAGDSSWTVLNHSEAMPFVSGLNTFATRIPVAAGNAIALYSSTYAAYCLTGVAPAETSAVEKWGPDTPIGGSFSLDSFTAGTRTALFAVIEPDADGDGFGDESQDLCPQRADLQSACPVVSIGKVTRKAAKKSLKLSFSTGGQSNIKLTGSARVPASGGRRAKTIRFKALSKATTATGDVVLTVKYPKSLRSALGRLPKGKKIKLTFKLSATGLINTATKTVRTSLRGRA